MLWRTLQTWLKDSDSLRWFFQVYWHRSTWQGANKTLCIHPWLSHEVKTVHNVWTMEDRKIFLTSHRKKIYNDSWWKTKKANGILINFAGKDLTRITVSTLHTIHWKRLQIAVVPGKNQETSLLILQWIVMGTQLLSCVTTIQSHSDSWMVSLSSRQLSAAPNNGGSWQSHNSDSLPRLSLALVRARKAHMYLPMAQRSRANVLKVFRHPSSQTCPLRRDNSGSQNKPVLRKKKEKSFFPTSSEWINVPPGFKSFYLANNEG